MAVAMKFESQQLMIIGDHFFPLMWDKYTSIFFGKCFFLEFHLIFLYYFLKDFFQILLLQTTHFIN